MRKIAAMLRFKRAIIQLPSVCTLKRFNWIQPTKHVSSSLLLLLLLLLLSFLSFSSSLSLSLGLF